MASLRQFPATPASGASFGVEWIQSQARMTLSYPVEADVSQDDIQVRIAGFEVEVRIKNAVVKALTGELQDLVRQAPHSWWILAGEKGPKTFVLQLLKVKQASWDAPWFEGKLHPKKIGRYWWNKAGKEVGEAETRKIKLGEYQIVKPGRPDVDDSAWYPPVASSVFAPLSDKYCCSPDDIVLGTNTKQDKKNLYLYIHFDSEALDYYQKDVPSEDLFAADFKGNSVYVFIRGDDQNPIINATFAGLIDADAATWKLTTNETFRNRQKGTAYPSPALMITVPKADGYTYEWPQVFDQCWMHRLMVSNQGELDELIEAAEKLETLPSDADGLLRWDLTEKSKRLENWQEERFQGLPEAQTYRRSGYDLESNDYWENVYDNVRENVKNCGFVSGPKVLEIVDDI